MTNNTHTFGFVDKSKPHLSNPTNSNPYDLHSLSQEKHQQITPQNRTMTMTEKNSSSTLI